MLKTGNCQLPRTLELGGASEREREREINLYIYIYTHISAIHLFPHPVPDSAF